MSVFWGFFKALPGVEYKFSRALKEFLALSRVWIEKVEPTRTYSSTGVEKDSNTFTVSKLKAGYSHQSLEFISDKVNHN